MSDQNPLPPNLRMGQAELDAFVREQAEITRSSLAQTPSDAWIPKLVVLGATHPGFEVSTHLFALALPFNDWQVKRGVMRHIGRSLYGDQVIPLAACLSSEAWLAPDAGGVMPRDSPDRQEVIVVCGTTLDRKSTSFVRFPVTRRADNTMQLGEVCSTEGQYGSPLLDELFNGFFERPLSAAAKRN